MVRIIRLIFLIVFVLTITDSFSQYNKRSTSGKKKKEKPTFYDLYLGMSGGEFGRQSFYGPSLGGTARKTFININKYMNISTDVQFTNQLTFFQDIGDSTSGVGGLINIKATINFNAGTGTYIPDKKKTLSVPVGGFIGPGIIIIAGEPARSSDPYGNEMETSSSTLSVGDIGPMINFGLRIRLSKTYFCELRIYGGFTVIEETAIGGGELHFPILMGKHSNKRW